MWRMLQLVKGLTPLGKLRAEDMQLPVGEPEPDKLVLTASYIVNIMALALPLAILQIYDRVLPNNGNETLFYIVVFLGGVVLVDCLLKHIRSYLMNWHAASFSHQLTAKAFAAMIKAGSSEFSRVSTSEHLERMNAINSLSAYQGGQSRLVKVDILFIPIFAGVFILVGGVVFGAIAVLFALFGYIAFRRADAFSDVLTRREDLDARKYDFIIEVLRSMRTVKAQAMEPLMMRRFERIQATASAQTKKTVAMSGATQTINAAFAAVSTMTIVSFGAYQVINGYLTIGAMACCMLLSSQLLQPLMRSLSAWNEIQRAQKQRSQISAIFPQSDTTPSQRIHRNHQPASGDPVDIRLESVSIGYGDLLVFDMLNLHIPAGRCIAIRGADGSGRSSLLRALISDTPLLEGRILANKDVINAPDMRFRDERIKYVGENSGLFRGTILENLSLFGAVTPRKALMAAQLIGLEPDIIRMPMGYDTFVKGGSAREIPDAIAQRICIARALAASPSVLLLDEANSLLDMNGERKLLKAIEAMRGKLTIIMSTHRPSMLRLADDVYDIQNGRLLRADNDLSEKNAATA